MMDEHQALSLIADKIKHQDSYDTLEDLITDIAYVLGITGHDPCSAHSDDNLEGTGW